MESESSQKKVEIGHSAVPPNTGLFLHGKRCRGGERKNGKFTSALFQAREEALETQLVTKQRNKTEKPQWQKHHDEMRKKHNVQQGTPWTNAGGLCRGVVTARGRDVVNAAYAILKKEGVEDMQSITVDISQCLSRKAWGGKVRNLTTSSALFAFCKDRLLAPPEHFNVLGLEGVQLTNQSDHSAKELAGQAMAAPCIALPLLCICASLPGLWVPAKPA